MEIKEILQTGIKELGLKYDDIDFESFASFFSLVIEKNKFMNLTGITEEREFYIKHYLDSLTCLCAIEDFNAFKTARVIDVGTGAGFPGVPISILTNVETVLLDSLRKRIDFLNESIETLDLSNVSAVHGRAEDFARMDLHRESYDYVFSRAVADLSVLLEYCIPFLRVGGNFVCQKGIKYKEELINAENALNILGCEVVEVKSVLLPFTDITRYIITIKKIKETPEKYPRKSGKPTKSPL